MKPEPAWLRRLTSPAAAFAVIAVFWAVLLAGVRNESVTFDEVGHVTAGYTYWKNHDYRLNYENGNLPQRLFALPILGENYAFPPTSAREWQSADIRGLGENWFHRMGNDTVSLLWRGRVAASVLAVALAVLVWACARSLFGPAGGMVALLLCVLNPGLLANGALMTSDTASAFFFLAALWGWWSLLHRFTPLRFALSTLATAGLFVSKMSAPLAVPLAVIFTLVRLIEGSPLPGRLLSEFVVALRRRQAALFLGAFVAQALLVVVLIWGFYGFRYAISVDSPKMGAEVWTALTGGRSLPEALETLPLDASARQQARKVIDRYVVAPHGWNDASERAFADLKPVLTADQIREVEELRRDGTLRSPVITVIGWLRKHQVLPEAYLVGYLHVWRFAQTRPAYFNGEFSRYGSSWFFPYTFFVKTPLPLLGLALLAAGVALWPARSAARLRAGLYATLPLWLFGGAYAALAVASHLNIGHRHLLPAYPVLFVLCGSLGTALVAAVASPAWRVIGASGAVLLLAHLIETAQTFPHYLAYFNGLVSPREAYRHLTDSSLDWGQDLPSVRDYIETHSAQGPFYLAYFGTGDPATYGVKARILPSIPGLFQPKAPPLLWRDLPAEAGQADVDALMKQFPDYDYIGSAKSDRAHQALLQLKPEAFRLSGGTYLFSATLIQAQWTPADEEYYQLVRRAVEAVFATSLDERRASLGKFDLGRWQEALATYDQSRRARLAAHLLRYRPDDFIGYSVLVYRLTDREIAEALEGPSPVRTDPPLPRTRAAN